MYAVLPHYFLKNISVCCSSKALKHCTLTALECITKKGKQHANCCQQPPHHPAANHVKTTKIFKNNTAFMHYNWQHLESNALHPHPFTPKISMNILLSYPTPWNTHKHTHKHEHMPYRHGHVCVHTHTHTHTPTHLFMRTHHLSLVVKAYALSVRGHGSDHT